MLNSRPKKMDFGVAFAQFSNVLSSLYGSLGHGGFMDPYQQVFDMCRAVPKAYDDNLFDAIADYLVDEVQRVLQDIVAHDDWVGIYCQRWTRYREASGYIDKICEYLNKILMKKKSAMQRALPPGKFQKQRIESLAFTIWRERLLHVIKTQHANRLVIQLLDMIRNDRDGKSVNHEIIRGTITSLVEVSRHLKHVLALYIDEFENKQMENTKAYYAAESNISIASLDISSFMKKAIDRLAEEELRSQKMCDISSRDKIKKTCEHQWVYMHQRRLHSAFATMIQEEMYEDCAMAYKLLLRINNGINQLLVTLEDHIRSLGKEIVARQAPNAMKEPKDVVEELVALQAKYMNICQDTFNNDSAFIAAVDKGFRSIVNDSYPNLTFNCAETLSRYSDSLLKRSAKSQLSESDIEDKLSKMINVFKYVDDQDVFQKFYSRMLAKRLIFGLSVSDDLEMNFLSKLKETCGVEYTSKLQRMFTDMGVSSDMTKRFVASMEKNHVSLGVDFNIMVLTAGSWPISGVVPTSFQLPVQLEKSVTKFTEFYLASHNGRKLSWLHHLSKADVKTNYLDRKYEINLSLHHLGILLQFNEGNEYTVSQLGSRTNLNEAETKRSLKALVDFKLLTTTFSTFEPTAIIHLNLGFTNKRTKLKVAAAIQMESQQEADSTRQAIEEDRRLYLQTVIVRIMKTRKESSHNELVQAVIEQSQSRFSPTITAIKKSIEQLIEKGYIDRSKHHLDEYEYVA